MTDTVRVPRAWLEAFCRDTDPTEPIADNGGTVWDMFCHEAAAMLAASPQGEGSSADTPVEAVAWRIRTSDGESGFLIEATDVNEKGLTHWKECGWTVQSLYTHPAPIKPSADTGELRERVAQIIGEAVNRRAPGQIVFSTLEDADAILDLIQSEKG